MVLLLVSLNHNKFNRLFEHHSHTSNNHAKINVYSFGLKPEEHQPSGTCNFSRIDTAQLVTGNPLSSSDKIYAVNYNVLINYEWYGWFSLIRINLYLKSKIIFIYKKNGSKYKEFYICWYWWNDILTATAPLERLKVLYQNKTDIQMSYYRYIPKLIKKELFIIF